MKESMFTGESLPWDAIVTRLTKLEERIRALEW